MRTHMSIKGQKLYRWRKQIGSKKRIYWCTNCNRKFKSAFAVMSHINSPKTCEELNENKM